MQSIRISDWSIVTKLFWANFLILAAVAGISGINILASRQVENSLLPLIDGDVKRIVHNAATARELNAVFSELHVLVNTFTQDQTILDSLGPNLLERIERQRDAATRISRDEAIHEGLTEAHARMSSFLGQCRILVELLRGMLADETAIDRSLTKLEETVTYALLEGKASGREYTLFSMEQVSASIPDFRNRLLRAKLLLSESVRARLGASQAGEAYEAPILAIIADLAASLRTVVTAGEQLAPLGNELIGLVQVYGKRVQEFQEALISFQGGYQDMKTSQERVTTDM